MKNFYSVPTQYIGEEITVHIGLKTVSAYFKHEIIKTHPRNHATGQWITDEKDYSKSALYHLEGTRDICIASAKEIWEATGQVITKILTSAGKIHLRKAQGILRLANSYSADRLELACLRASAYDNYTYNAISNILKNKLDQKSTESFGVKKISNIKDSAYVKDAKE
jgi:hypothetical protein